MRYRGYDVRRDKDGAIRIRSVITGKVLHEEKNGNGSREVDLKMVVEAYILNEQKRRGYR